MSFVIGCIVGAAGLRLWQMYRDRAAWKRLVDEFKAGGTD